MSNLIDDFVKLLGIDPPHPDSREFYGALLEAALLHADKQKDYGTENDPFANIRSGDDFGIPAWKAAIIRGNDKMTRLKTYAKKGSLTNESAEDSFKDLAVYSLIALVLHRKEVSRE